MKKLLQVNTFINSRATGRIAEEIGKLVISKGWESYFAFGRDERQSDSLKIKIGSDLDVKIHGLKTRLLDRHGFGSKQATLNLIKTIEKINPNIIHLHNVHGYYLNIELLFQYLGQANKPVVWTIHDCWPITGHCVYFDYVKCNKWESLCQKCPQTKTYPASIHLDQSKKNFLDKKRLFNLPQNLTLVPVSDWLSEILKRSFLSEKKVEVIKNGINTSLFHNIENSEMGNKLALKNETILLGVANEWTRRKGLNDFILLNEKLNNQYKIILVGLTKKQIRVLPEDIIAFEKTENIEELASLYSLADIFINPTWEDNLPTTNLEAQSCGSPVITYNTGGSPETINNKTGLVVEKGDINGLVNAIKEIQNKGSQYYSNSCIQNTKINFNSDFQFLKYLELYESILSK